MILFSEGHVGDKIFHVWECDSDEQRMLIHSCSVTDGKGYKFDLVVLKNYKRE